MPTSSQHHIAIVRKLHVTDPTLRAAGRMLEKNVVSGFSPPHDNLLTKCRKLAARAGRVVSRLCIGHFWQTDAVRDDRVYRTDDLVFFAVQTHRSGWMTRGKQPCIAQLLILIIRAIRRTSSPPSYHWLPSPGRLLNMSEGPGFETGSSSMNTSQWGFTRRWLDPI
jgi:hypothetical protein